MLDSAIRRQPPLRLSRTLTAAAALALAFVILLAGTSAADLVKRKSGDFVVEQVFRQEEQKLSASENKLLRRKTLELFKQYLFAFTDAAIQFDIIPRMDSKVFLAMATAMPEDVTAQRIVFHENYITLYCSAGSEDSPELFLERLQTKAQFKSVSATMAVQKENCWYFEVDCVPHVAQGQLAMAAAQPED